MKCIKCGKNNSDNSNFCTQCGEKLTMNHSDEVASVERNGNASQNHNVVPIIIGISVVVLAAIAFLVIIFLQFDKSKHTSDIEKQNKLTSSDSQAPVKVKEPVETENPKSTTEVTKTVTSDATLITSLKEKYGASTVEYTGDIITVDRGGDIVCPLGFNASEKKIDNWGKYFTVYQDPEMKYPMGAYVICDYDKNALIIPPPGDGVAELSTNGRDVDLSDLSGSFLDNHERWDSWGNFGELYLAQTMDMETGEVLETPHITIVKVNTELKEAPVVQYTCDDNGVATINWTPVEGATEYILFSITKWQGIPYAQGFDNKMRAFARTSDTSWSASSYEYEDTVLIMNQLFANYITSEDDIVGGREDKNGNYSEIMMEHLGVIAVTQNGCSPVSNLCPLKSYAQILPELWAHNQNNADVDTVGITVDLLPAEMSITMCDGSTSKRVLEYDIDNYEIDKDKLNIIGRASGSLLEHKFSVKVKDFGTLEADLKALQERQEKLKNKGGVINKSIQITNDSDNTTDGDAEPVQVTTDGDAQSKEQTPPANSELNIDIPVTANSQLSEYIAIQMLNSREVIDLSAFPESSNKDIVADAYLEAKYQNPLVMGIKDAAYNNQKHLLYVKYDDEPAVTAQKREAVQKKASEIVAEIITEDMSSLEKENAINKYLCDHAVYDDNALANAKKNDFKSVDQEYLDSFTPYGVLINGVGVCASYAGAFKVLADAAGLESMVITGYLQGNLPHAWNRVKIDDQWLSVDSTNNDNDVVQNALLNVSDVGVKGVLVEDDRFVVDEKLYDYKGDTDANEFYHVNGKYFDTDAIASQLVEELNADGDAMLRTDYTIDDEQFQAIAQSVANGVGGDIKGYYWLGVIHLTK